MSSTRKSPTQSATLYKVGTKKTGNDGNTWVIVENKNNIKKWQLYKKINDNKKIQINKQSIDLLYNKPKIKKNNWEKWLEYTSKDLNEFIHKIRNSYNDIKKLNIKVFEVIEATSTNGYWIDQYPTDYIKSKYPLLYTNSIPHIIIRYKLDTYLHLSTDYFQICIEGYLFHISDNIKEKLVNYLNTHFYKQYSLYYAHDKNYGIVFCVKDPNKKLKK